MFDYFHFHFTCSSSTTSLQTRHLQLPVVNGLNSSLFTLLIASHFSYDTPASWIICVSSPVRNNGTPYCGKRVPNRDCESAKPATQDRRKERRGVYDHGRYLG